MNRLRAHLLILAGVLLTVAGILLVIIGMSEWPGDLPPCVAWSAAPCMERQE